MSVNAKEFFFSNRPLQNNLDYLKKNDSNSEINWEGDSELRMNSAINMQHSQHSKVSTFKQIATKEEEAVNNHNQSKRDTNDKQVSELRNVKSSQDNHYQGDNMDQDQKEIHNHEKKQDSKLQQSPYADKSQQYDGSTNQATNHNEIDIQPENREESLSQKQNLVIQNNQINLVVHSDLEQNLNSTKHAANQQIDLKGDYSPAGSQTSRMAKSPDSQQSPIDLKNTLKNYKSPGQSEGQENQSPQAEKQIKNIIEKPKIFKFKTELESVHEVECWKDYNRENSRESKKIGCSCEIF